MLGTSGTCHPPIVTEHYVNAAYGGVEGCIQAQSHGSTADELDFKSVRINRTKATALVVPSGGLYNGERLTVSLVHDPRWAVDELRSNVPVGP